MSSRLDQGYPELAGLLGRVDRLARGVVVQRIAERALARTELDAPDSGVVDLGAWAAGFDDIGWGLDEAGEPVQSESDFFRARAACAYRDAALAVGSDDAAADSVYEAVIVLGEETTRDLLVVWPA